MENLTQELQDYINFRKGFEILERDCNLQPTPEKWEELYKMKKVGVLLEEKINYDDYVQYIQLVDGGKMRIATPADFKIGTVLIDSEDNEFGIRRKYSKGIWESNYRVHFENEAGFYRVRI